MYVLFGLNVFFCCSLSELPYQMMSSCFLSGMCYLTYPQGWLVLDFPFCSLVENSLTMNQNNPSLSCSLMWKISAFVLVE